MTKASSIIFTIDAGKYDGDDINWKYSNAVHDSAEALVEFNSVRDYPVVEFCIQTAWDDGTRTRVSVFDGIQEKLIDGKWVQVDIGGMTADERAAYVKQSRTI